MVAVNEDNGMIKVPAEYNLKSLNVGRAIACIIVLIHHFLLAFYEAPIVLINDGNLAVCFFLILCGFILPIKIFTNKDTVPDKASRKIHGIFFYSIKRYLRLFTVVALCNLVAYLILCVGGYYTTQFSETYSINYIHDFYAYKVNLKGFIYTVFVDSFIRGSSLDSPLWTIKYEFIGAILCRILVVTLYRNKYRHYVYLLISASLSFILKDFYWILPVLGLFLSDVLFNTNKRAGIIDKLSTGIKHINAPVALILALIVYSAIVFDQVLTVVRTVSALFFILCLLNTVKSNRPLEKIAAYSFHVYSIHWIVICSLGTFLMLKMTSVSYVLRSVLVFIVIVVVVTVLAFLLKNIEDKVNKNIQPQLSSLENKGAKSVL